jgi:hypothetical protein
MVAITSPFEWPLTFTLALWFAVFIAIPIKLIIPKLKTPFLVLGILSFAALAWWSRPLSRMSSKNPDFGHCGQLTYTGMFYPLRGLLTEAHRDDLEARNQLCWVRKLISRVPEKFDFVFYSKLIHETLLKPERKYRVSLPLIAALFVKINFSDEGGARNVYDSLHFWIGHYTEEISAREYPVWNWPHSDYIKWEYELVEKNWQSLIDGLVIGN